jgi:GMP synthase-like glutamine amidotransferase
MTTALVLQTQDNGPPGLLGDWAETRAVELDVLRVDRWERLPEPGGYSFAVVLGSDESVVGPLRGWVAQLLEWIGRADAVGLPVLGICFGAQALAAALGGSAVRLMRLEHAWVELDVGGPYAVPAGPWLALHEDAVVLPASARELARNEFGTQAFAIDGHLGVQFHPEVTPSILRRWVAEKGGSISADLLIGAAERCRLAAAGALKLFDGFIGLEGPPSRLTAAAGVN